MRGSLEHRDTILTAYNGQLIRQYGTTRLKCVHETTTHEAELFVADTPGPVILGLLSCHKLNLVTLNCAVSEHLPPLNSKEYLQRQYPDCFKGIGKFRETFHITLNPAVTPSRTWAQTMSDPHQRRREEWDRRDGRTRGDREGRGAYRLGI